MQIDRDAVCLGLCFFFLVIPLPFGWMMNGGEAKSQPGLLIQLLFAAAAAAVTASLLMTLKSSSSLRGHSTVSLSSSSSSLIRALLFIIHHQRNRVTHTRLGHYSNDETRSIKPRMKGYSDRVCLFRRFYLFIQTQIQTTVDLH